jgi:hypothetical protein
VLCRGGLGRAYSPSLVVLDVVLAMVLSVMLCRLMGVMRGMQAVRVRHVGVMTGLFMVAVIIVLGRFAVMLSRALMVLGRRRVMLAAMVGFCAHLDHPVVGVMQRDADLIV